MLFHGTVIRPQNGLQTGGERVRSVVCDADVDRNVTGERRGLLGTICAVQVESTLADSPGA